MKVNMSKIDRNLSILIVLALFAVVGLYVWTTIVLAELDSLMSLAAFPLRQEQEIKPSLTTAAFLVIDDGGTQKRFEFDLKETTTAFALLSLGAEESGLDLKTKEYDIGVFIEAIGSRENGQDGKYWLYYVNGEMPQTAADKKEIRAGDRVEFKFERSPF